MRLSQAGQLTERLAPMPVKPGDPIFSSLSAISAPHIPRVLLNEPAGLLEVLASRLMSWMLNIIPFTYWHVLFVQTQRDGCEDPPT
jgi:hypothetical protein